jgi:hypothetical protein
MGDFLVRIVGGVVTRAVSQLLWPDKDRDVWFSLGENHEKAYLFPDFLQHSTGREQLCATFFAESRRQFGGSTKLHRKSGFELHPLRNCVHGKNKFCANGYCTRHSNNCSSNPCERPGPRLRSKAGSRNKRNKRNKLLQSGYLDRLPSKGDGDRHRRYRAIGDRPERVGCGNA